MEQPSRTNKNAFISIIIILSSIFMAYFLSDKITSNDNLLMILTTIFSIFCGFIFLILPLIGQLALPIANESEDESYICAYNAKIDLFWYKLIFYAYFINIIFIFLYLMGFESLNTFLKYIVTFSSSLLIGFSFLLPIALTNLTRKAIERKRKELQ